MSSCVVTTLVLIPILVAVGVIAVIAMIGVAASCCDWDEPTLPR